VSAVSIAFGAIAACSSGNGAGPGSSTASHSGSGTSSGTTSSGGSQSPSDAASHADGGGALLVDDMEADSGTQIALVVPAGDTPGSYYTYDDGPNSSIQGTSQLNDSKLAAPITNADGTTISGELCVSGSVLAYAGLGMNLVYTKPADASATALSSPVPFDASRYNGVSFYIFVPADAGGAITTVHFGIPDTQTADPTAWPKSDCAQGDAGCDDDFGADVSATPGAWTKVAFSWNSADSMLSQQNWGAQFGALRTNALIGMKWQANGPGPDAGSTDPFDFCISDIYFTP
jgi:hypothetical protein